ncbi:MAG TPA: YIP1 family protein, partial [Candidatus Binataceae bacterium]|nr:YIP1 family protein [Candidatus Binataceae bacterium]
MDFAKLTDINYARILIRPRTTIRAIVDRDPRDRVIVLVVISGFVSALALAVQSRSPAAFMIGTRTIPVIAATTMRKIRIAQIVAAPVLAVVFLYINGALLRWAGGLLGGAAKSVEVRAALGWSSIPSMLSALF